LVVVVTGDPPIPLPGALQVYQSLDRELQKHVSHQDTLQQSQTWLSAVLEELQLHHQQQPPSGLQEALKQVPLTDRPTA